MRLLVAEGIITVSGFLTTSCSRITIGLKWGAAALVELVHNAKARFPQSKIEVEVDTMEQIPYALEAGADIIMLDNFDNALLEEAVELIDGKALTEASGNITLDRLPSMADLGVDFISVGALTHQSRWIDIGLDAL